MTTDWSASLSLTDAAVRGLAYHDGKVYVVGGGADSTVWEINASDGTGVKKLFTMPGVSAWQADRHGDYILVVSDNGYLYQYVLNGDKWVLGEANNLGADGTGPYYGVGINDAGNGFWTSSHYYRVSYFDHAFDIPTYPGAKLNWEYVVNSAVNLS